jgi:hypothetical protein
LEPAAAPAGLTERVKRRVAGWFGK